MTAEPPRARAFFLAFALLAASAVATLWIVDYLPTNDGPNHVLLGYLSAHFGDPGRGYGDFLAPAWPVTSVGFHAVFSVVERVMPWKHALRVVLSLGVLLWVTGFAALVHALRPERAPLAAIGCATALSWAFYMGLFSYWLAQGLSLWLLAFAVRRASWTARDHLAIGAWLLVVAVCHSFAATVTGVVLLGVAVARPAPRGRVRSLGSLALAGAPSALVGWLSLTGAKEGWEADNPTKDALAAAWTSGGDRVAQLWTTFAGGPAWRGLVPLALVLLGLGATAIRARRREASRDEIGLAAAATALLAVALASPVDLNVWQALPPRFLPLPFAIGVALVPLEAVAPAARSAAAAACAAFAVASIVWSGVYHRALAAFSADALEVASAPVRRSGRRLPLVLVPEESAIANANPHVNVGHLFALEQGGMTPYLFATRPTLHPFVYKEARREFFPPFPPRFQFVAYQNAGKPGVPAREAQLAWMAQLGTAYEDVILWSTPADIDAFVERGYRVDARKNGVALLRFEPCALAVEVETAAVLAEPLLVQYGWQPFDQKVEMLEVAAGAETGGLVPARFAAAPCGPIWIRVVWDRDRSGKAGPRDGFCAGADERGQIALTLARGAPPFRCKPIAPDTP